MGSCISKCKTKKNSKKKESQQEECKCKCQCQCQCIEKCNKTSITATITSTSTSPLAQDKLVISQAPNSSSLHLKTSLVSPSSPLTSTSSAKSSCANSNYYPNTSSSSSSSSCSLLSSASSLASTTSSVLSSKLDHSFTNDYLWSCVKENPQILNGDYLPLKVANPRRNSLPIRSQTNSKKPNRPKDFYGPGPSQQRVVARSAPQKRPRCNSPSNLIRQKSFRREPDVEPNRPISRSGRDLRPISPSPSRRFNNVEVNNQGRNFTSSMRRENSYVRPSSPSKGYSGNSRRNGRSNKLLVKKENEDMMNGVNSKIKELAMGGLVKSQDVEMMPIEDAENPHIALDCFIFL